MSTDYYAKAFVGVKQKDVITKKVTSESTKQQWDPDTGLPTKPKVIRNYGYFFGNELIEEANKGYFSSDGEARIYQKYKLKSFKIDFWNWSDDGSFIGVDLLELDLNRTSYAVKPLPEAQIAEAKAHMLSVLRSVGIEDIEPELHIALYAG